MKRMILTTAMFIGAALTTGWVAAQTAPPAASKEGASSKAAPGPAAGAGVDHKMDHGRSGKGAKGEKMAGGMMGHGGDGRGGMMGGGMMGMGSGSCPMAVGSDTKVEVKNLPKGVTITFTNDDAAKVAKLQKMAEAMRLAHEAHTP